MSDDVLRKLIKIIEAQGGRIEQGGKHLKVFARSGDLVAILPHGLQIGKSRAHYNTRAQLRRAGFKIR